MTNPLDYLGTPDASTTIKGKVRLATITETTTGTRTDLATTPAGVAAVAIAGSPDASTTQKGIIEIATNSEASAASATDKAIVPSNLTSVFASPPAIGGTSAAAGTFSSLTASGGTVSLTGTSSSQLNVTGAGVDLTLDSAAGQAILTGGEAAANAVRIQADDAAGGIDVDAGTGGITIDSTDAISIDAAAASNFTTSAGDLSLISSAGSVNITGAQDAADAIVLTASAGGIDLLATGEAGQDIDISNTGGSVNITATEDAANAIYIHANGGTSETIKIHADQGTGTSSIALLSDAGGINLTSTGLANAAAIALQSTAGGIDADAALQINIASSQNATDAIRVNASAGGIDIDAAGAAGEDITIDNAAGSVGISAGEAIEDSINIESTAGGVNILASGASAGLDIDIVATGSSINLTSTEAVASAIVITASDADGGISVDAGSNGISIGTSADCTPLAIGDIAPTVSRSTTISGGTVVTASVTDTLDLAPDGATTNADSVKTVNINTGTVAVGQLLTNIASGAVTSGTHTTSIDSGNVTAGTVVTNISTGTGTKTVNLGNADANTTLNLDATLAINNDVNADVTIIDGTSTGSLTIGSANAGAIAVDTGAGISLDAATASNFACAAGDLTVDATTGSLILSANEDVNDCISIIADNGGIDITCSSASAGQDIDIETTGSSVNISSSEAVGDAITITASDAAGGIDLSAGTGGISFDSGIIVNVTAVDNDATPYTVLGTDYVIAADTTASGGGALTLTLPASPATGRTIIVQDVGGGAAGDNITISGNGKNISSAGASAATAVIDSAYGNMYLVYNGSFWSAFDVA